MNSYNKPIPILFEDNHILVVEKPVNIPVQGDKTKDLDLLTILNDGIKARNNPGNVYLGLVHRIDRPVGGVMVFAKTSKSASLLSDQIRKKNFNKTYLAVIHGSLEAEKGELRHHLFKIEKLNFSKVVKPTHTGGKEAVLEYETIAKSGYFSLVKIALKTGRHHQIRVQFAEEGHPLFGDQKYGKGKNKPGQQTALWAYSVEFEHPVTNEKITVVSSPPKQYPWELFPSALPQNSK